MQLHVRVIEASDIAKMDFLSKSDPYCILQLSSSSELKRTRVIDNTDRPRWDEEFHFPVMNPQADILHILMKDKDTVSADDDMAKLELSLLTLQLGVVADQWYDMKPVKGVKKGGRLHLLLHLAGPQDTPFITRAPGQFQQNMGGMGGAAMAMGMMAGPMMAARPPQPFYGAQPQPMYGQPQPYSQPPPQQQPYGYPQYPPQPQAGYPQYPSQQQAYGQYPPQPGYGQYPQQGYGYPQQQYRPY